MAGVPNKQDSIVYLFSSVPPNRPNYKRGVLNALCYPNGHQQELSYKKSYISPSLFKQRSTIQGKKGVFVFLDYKKPDHDFTPIRFLTINALSPKEEAGQYSDTTRMYIRAELGPLIPFDVKWNDEIRSLPLRPRHPLGPDSAGTEYFYVLEGPDLFPKTSNYSQRDIWDHLVERIAEANSLKDCVFLCTGHISQFSKGELCKFSDYGNYEKAYRLLPNSIYQLDLRIFDRHSADSPQEVVIRSSSELIAVSQPFITGVGGPTDHSVLIVSKRTVESTLATLVVDLQARDSSKRDSSRVVNSEGETLGSSPALVIAAKPRYLLALAPSRFLIVCFTFFVFLGALLTSTSAEFYKNFVCRPEIWALGSKIVGAALLSAAAYLAFRKLPSGGSAG